MQMNFLVIALAALIPMIIGFLWYNPKLLGTAWMKETGITEEKAKSANMPLTFGLSYVLSFLMAMVLQFFVIHQWGIFSLVEGDIEAFNSGAAAAMMSEYGSAFRTFGHGAFHGMFAGLFIAFPILATNGMFEQKSWKLIFINGGYWILSMALMGGVLCQWG